MTLRRLPQSTIKLIGSSQVITSVSAAVKELIENSLDAGALSIDVKLENHGLDKIEVRDDGCGINKDDVEQMCKKSYTSKISDFSDLDELHSYGFRGEALNALCACSKLVVTTKTDEDSLACTYIFDNNGSVKDSKPSHINKGTIVVAEGLFRNLPVRRQFLTNGRRKSEEIKKVESIVKSLAVIHPRLRLTLTHNKFLIWQKNSVVSLKQSLAQAIPPTIISQLDTFHYSDEKLSLKMDVLLPRKSCNIPVTCYSNRDDAFYLFINERPLKHREIEKTLEGELIQYFGHYIPANKYPLCFLSIKLPPNGLDVNLEPNKTKVIIKNLDQLIETIKTQFVKYYTGLHEYVDAKTPVDIKLPKRKFEPDLTEEINDKGICKIPKFENCKNDQLICTAVIEKETQDRDVTVSLNEEEKGENELSERLDRSSYFNKSFGAINTDEQCNTDIVNERTKNVNDDTLNAQELDDLEFLLAAAAQTSILVKPDVYSSQDFLTPEENLSSQNFDDKLNNPETSLSQNVDGKNNSENLSSQSFNNRSNHPETSLSQNINSKSNLENFSSPSFNDKPFNSETLLSQSFDSKSNSGNSSSQNFNVRSSINSETLLSQISDDLLGYNDKREEMSIDDTNRFMDEPAVGNQTINNDSKIHGQLIDVNLNENDKIAGCSNSKLDSTSVNQELNFDNVTFSQWSKGHVLESTNIPVTIKPGDEKHIESDQHLLDDDSIFMKSSKCDLPLERSVSSQMGCKNMSAFTKFAKEMRAKIIQQTPGISFTRVASELAAKWRDLADEEKNQYELMAREEKLKVAEKKPETPDTNLKQSTMKLKKIVEPLKGLKKIKYDNVFEINLTINDLRSRMKSGCMKEPDDHAQIHCKLDEDLFFFSSDNILSVMSSSRINQVINFYKNMSTMTVPLKILENNIPIKVEDVGEKNWHTLQCLETSVDLRNNTIVISNELITKNGFRIEVIDGIEGKKFEITDIPTHVSFYGVNDLKELLEVMDKNGISSDLTDCRPLKIVSYIRSETIRMCCSKQYKFDVRTQDSMFNFWIKNVRKKFPFCPHHKPVSQELIKFKESN